MVLCMSLNHRMSTQLQQDVHEGIQSHLDPRKQFYWVRIVSNLLYVLVSP